MPSNYSLFKNNSAARSARLGRQEEDVELNRPAFRRSNLAGSAAKAMRLADEERKRQQTESEGPGEGERPEHTIETKKQVSMGLRAVTGTTFERANRPEQQTAESQATAPVSQPAEVDVSDPAAVEKKSSFGSKVAKFFSLLGGDK